MGTNYYLQAWNMSEPTFKELEESARVRLYELNERRIQEMSYVNVRRVDTNSEPTKPDIMFYHYCTNCGYSTVLPDPDELRRRNFWLDQRGFFRKLTVKRLFKKIDRLQSIINKQQDKGERS